MKTKLLILSVIFCSTVLLAFRSTPASSLSTGTYGIHMDCGGSGKSKIELSLNPDNSFRYFNNSGKELLDVKGTYTFSNNIIRLNTDSKADIAKTWKFDPECQCIKSRKGMLWTRICKLD